jgi:hypothetical protein
VDRSAAAVKEGGDGKFVGQPEQGLTCVSAAPPRPRLCPEGPLKFLRCVFRVPEKRADGLILKVWHVCTLLILGPSMKGQIP